MADAQVGRRACLDLMLSVTTFFALAIVHHGVNLFICNKDCQIVGASPSGYQGMCVRYSFVDDTRWDVSSVPKLLPMCVSGNKFV